MRRSARPVLLVLAVMAGCQSPGVSSTGGTKGSADGAAPAPPSPPPAPPSPPPPPGIPPQGFPDGGAPGTVPPPGSQVCAKEQHVAEKVPVDIVLLVDASDSMDGLSGTESKWQRVRSALDAFVRDPGSAGLGVGLSFFPSPAPEETHACVKDADCANVPDVLPRCRQEGVCFAPGLPVAERLCSPGLVSPFNCAAGLTCVPRGRCPQSNTLCVEGGAPCPGGARCVTTPGVCRVATNICSVGRVGTLEVPIADLPGNAARVTTALAGRQPDGNTPMARAVDSVVAALAARRAALPGRKSVLVLATDGFPSCDATETVDAVVTRLERAFAAAPSLPTYVVGVFAAGDIATAQTTFQRFATAGGTRNAFLLTAGNDLSQTLLQALKQIRGQAVACDYGIPPTTTGPLDRDKVNVSTTSNGQPAELGRVPNAAACAGKAGWYYDDPAAARPRIVLCPESCARLQGDPAARVDLVFGCATRVIE
jgi:hypothetical protein